MNGGKMEYTEVDIKESVITFLTEENLELYDINIVNFPNIDKIEIFIFSEENINYSVIERLNYQLQRHLEEFNLFKGDYELVISTPGIERTLKTDRHFELAKGEEVKIKLYSPVNNEYTFQGELIESDVNKVTIQIEEEQQIFEIDNIKRARVNYNKFKQKVK
jgi:ribosome maturation factor RimP